MLCRAAVAAAPGEGPAAAPVSSAAGDLIRRGEYVARVGNCTGCHTAPGSAPLAGGLELHTPLGNLYSTNITPDRQAGIGNYSFEQFDRSMRRGVAADGHNLYPAMPYPSYAKVSESDMRALYAYLMQGVAPSKLPNRASRIKWPLNMRWGLALWNRLFLQETPFKPDPSKDAVWNRGAYLAQGLGHCGACHTPRGIGFQERAMTQDGPNGDLYLAGETVEAWRAPSLRGLWTVPDTVRILKTGLNRFSTASGSMVEVIHNSTQYFTDADLAAIATYMKSLPPGRDELPMPPPPPPAPAPANSPVIPAGLTTTPGGQGYAQYCADCHGEAGTGMPGVFPPLARNPSVSSRDPASLVHITLAGGKTAQTAAKPEVYTMPSFADLSDQEIAEILSFVRKTWGNDAGAISPAQVKKARAKLKPAPIRRIPKLIARAKDFLLGRQ